jgi:hypothetical protein
MMGEKDGLGPLQMRIPGHDDIFMALCCGHKRFLQPTDLGEDPRYHLAKIESLIESNLIIATPPCVELASDRTELFNKSVLDEHMDIFGDEPVSLLCADRNLQRAGVKLTPDLKQSPLDLACFVAGDNLLAGEHPNMRKASFYILPIQSYVDSER